MTIQPIIPAAIALIALLVHASPVSASTPDSWVDVEDGEFDTTLLSDVGRSVLNDSEFKWRHAQSDHFVFHFERKMFAAKVGRMAEFFYDHIAADLKGREDKLQGRSHIFIFRSEEDWQYFLRRHGTAAEWAFSYVSGPSMYLQQADNTSSSGDVLSHEMTHVIFNRFFPGRLPLWLNEGTAEWYEEFGYAAFKGIKKSRSTQFDSIRTLYPVEALLTASSYPSSTREVDAFYQTAKYVVGFLMLEHPIEVFAPFVQDAAAGRPAEAALRDHYGYENLNAFAKAFHDFID